MEEDSAQCDHRDATNGNDADDNAMDKIRTKSRQSKERNLCTQPLMAPFNPRGHVEGEEGVQKKKGMEKKRGTTHKTRR